MGRHEPSTPEGRGKGELEGEILAALHEAAPTALTPGEVLDRLVDSKLAYTTVVTALTRLQGKGVLRRDKRGRAFAYTPVTDESGLAARQMRKALDARPDRAAVLTHFVGELSADDEQLLRRLLDAEN